GDEYFGESIELIPGSLTEYDSIHFGKPVIINFPTFTETANMAGMSRVMGGYHIQADNIAGLQLGRDVATQAWEFYNDHLGK
ncbi:MAG: haloperoxidase, partial [Zobellia laminariae]